MEYLTISYNIPLLLFCFRPYLVNAIMTGQCKLSVQRSLTNIMKVNSPAVVTCVGLTKIYHTGVVALNDLTLTIEPGMSFGLMDENGAGKSTLVRLLMGFIFPTKGQLNVLGETEVRRAHSRIGYLHERPYVELRLTARSYLTFRAARRLLASAMGRNGRATAVARPLTTSINRCTIVL